MVYCPQKNPKAGKAGKVILPMTFEPGVPIGPFDEDAWAVELKVTTFIFGLVSFAVLRRVI